MVVVGGPERFSAVTDAAKALSDSQPAHPILSYLSTSAFCHLRPSASHLILIAQPPLRSRQELAAKHSEPIRCCQLPGRHRRMTCKLLPFLHCLQFALLALLPPPRRLPSNLASTRTRPIDISLYNASIRLSAAAILMEPMAADALHTLVFRQLASRPFCPPNCLFIIRQPCPSSTSSGMRQLGLLRLIVLGRRV